MLCLLEVLEDDTIILFLPIMQDNIFVLLYLHQNGGVFVQSFECNKCTSASSAFPENSALKFDQFRCMCICPAASWC